MDPHYVPKTKRQRSIVDIVYDMVVPAVGRSTKKHILYRADISSTQVGRVLFLGAIGARPAWKGSDLCNDDVYHTTQKGMKFLAVL